MTNTSKLLNLLAGLIIVSILSTVVLHWVMRHDINNIENTLNASQEFRFELQALNRHQAEFIAIKEASQAEQFEQSAANLADKLAILTKQLIPHVSSKKINELELAFSQYLHSFSQLKNQKMKIGLSPSSGLRYDVRKQKKLLTNLVAGANSNELLTHYLTMQIAEDQLLNSYGSPELLIESFYNQYNQLTSQIKESGYLQGEKLLTELNQYQSLVSQLFTLQHNLGNKRHSGIYYDLVDNQKNLIRSTAGIISQLKSKLGDKQENAQWFLISALLWICALLCQAGFVVWKSLLRPLFTLQNVTNDALNKHGLSTFPDSREFIPDHDHPVVASVNKLVDGIELRIGNIKRFASQLNNDVSLILDSTNNANTAYSEQVSKLRRNEISLKSLLRTVYKNSSVTKKAYLQTRGVDKKLRRYNDVVFDSMEQLQNLKSCTKQIGNDAAQLSLYGSLAITSNRNQAGQGNQDEQLNALKRRLQQTAIDNRRHIIQMNKSLELMMANNADTLDSTGNSSQQMNSINVTMKSLMDSTVQQANKFNSIKSTTQQLYNNAKAGMIETKCLSMAGKNAIANIESLCQLLDYFNIDEPAIEDEKPNANYKQKLVNESMKLDLIHYLNSNDPEPEHGMDEEISQENKPARKKPDLRLIIN